MWVGLGLMGRWSGRMGGRLGKAQPWLCVFGAVGRVVVQGCALPLLYRQPPSHYCTVFYQGSTPTFRPTHPPTRRLRLAQRLGPRHRHPGHLRLRVL